MGDVGNVSKPGESYKSIAERAQEKAEKKKKGRKSVGDRWRDFLKNIGKGKR